MIPHAAWGIAAASLDAASFPVYAWDVYRRGRKPGRVGWIMYGVFYTYLAAAQAAAGAVWSDLIAVTEAAGCAYVAWLAIGHGVDDLVRREGDRWWMLPVRNPVTALCFAWLAVICVAWPQLGSPGRVVAAVSVDAVATSQVIAYARRHGDESARSWAMYGLAGGVAGLAVTEPWPSVLFLYPVAAEIFAVLVLWALWAHARRALS